jgi:3-phosphoshikimate 1-carboxyvinyltransferase
MDLIINKSPSLNGTIQVPSSKSYSQRALALSLLVKKIYISNLGNSDDEKAALDIIKQTGAIITEISPTEICIENKFDFNTNIELNCGESGLSARLFSCLFILNQGQTTIIGNGSLLKRPMQTLFEIFEFLELEYTEDNNSFPIQFKGKRAAQDIRIDGAISSQYISGLLFYLVGLEHSENLVLCINNPTSIPYIQMSMDILNSAGTDLHWFGDDTILISPSILKDEVKINIEGDWSSAAYFMVAAAIDGNISFKNLEFDSAQADIQIWDVLEEYGANVFIEKDSIDVKSNDHFSFEFDATHCPDLIPILSVLAIFADGKSTIYGTERLVHKESNRLVAIKEILDLVKISYSEIENGIEIIGNRTIATSNEHFVFNSYSDHRIIMSSAILSLYLHRSQLIGVENVSKSYPDFFNDLKKIGGNITYLN